MDGRIARLLKWWTIAPIVVLDLFRKCLGIVFGFVDKTTPFGHLDFIDKPILGLYLSTIMCPLKKSRKRLFRTPKLSKITPQNHKNEPIAKNDPSILPKWAIFWSKTAIIGVIYQPLEVKIHAKVKSDKIWP